MEGFGKPIGKMSYDAITHISKTLSPINNV